MPNLSGELVLPGLVDVHAHLREPGNNHAETIASGTRAALMGGYALIGDMPNTPGHPTWSEERLLEKHEIAKRTAYIPTTFHAGSQPSSDNVGELEKMANLSLWLKLYGAPTTGNTRDYEAREFKDIASEWHRVAPDKPIGLHAGKNNLEDMIGLVAGDLNHPLHIHHVSTRREVQLSQAAKDRDLPITSGVCPHHLLKTSHDVRSEGWFARMQPPLTDQAEAEELMHYLANGYIDIIETDHAPHSIKDKQEAELDNPNGVQDAERHITCFGVPGIEFAAPLMFYQVKRGHISMERVVEAMSTRPAELMGIAIDPATTVRWDMSEYRIGSDSEAMSASSWTPYLGKLAVGKIEAFELRGRRLISLYDNVVKAPEVVTQRGTVV
ncbi:MAG TPA: dihydroorotase family protein [Candidatus Binatia bacterium]|nr:dihydroorotase family protein [Candidatus Binatia bacterium]